MLINNKVSQLLQQVRNEDDFGSNNILKQSHNFAAAYRVSQAAPNNENDFLRDGSLFFNEEHHKTAGCYEPVTQRSLRPKLTFLKTQGKPSVFRSAEVITFRGLGDKNHMS